jgi:murein DD-endopeptidase MepM/ murein hydrolase activator NlpD
VRALAILVAAAALAPSQELPSGYVAARDALRQHGRSVAALVAAGKAREIRAEFNPELASQLPLATVKGVLTRTLRTAALGSRLGESELPIGRDRRIYIADHRWGAKVLALTVIFDRSWRIAGVDLRPRTPLPPDPRARYRLATRLTLPFRGEWWVFWGGPTERQNYHVVAPDQRHAYDFVVWRQGATHRGDGTANRDYWDWGREILAPADGVVVEAVDGVRDNRPQVQVENPQAPAGNHVVLDLGHGEYALLAHMRRGSLRVHKGDHVRRGEVLGLCGNSGNSSEPHLHFHVQDGPRLFVGVHGLPVLFHDYVADGRHVERGSPVQGQFLR